MEMRRDKWINICILRNKVIEIAIEVKKNIEIEKN